MHLVMFDIDGTLVDSMGFDTELYATAVEAELGGTVDRDWGRYEHVSDSGILEQLVREAGRSAEHSTLAARVQQRFVRAVRDSLQREPLRLREIAGAKRLVERLSALPRVKVAVATGGWEETARLKLAHIGIDTTGLAFASSSDAPARADIMRLAAQRAMGGAAFGRATYFGDGAWDKRASEQLGYDFVAIGGAVAHHRAYTDFRNTDEIVAGLLAASALGSSA
jgi:phosphoglycolate phosphatase-like HAD superfamily hydrolase